MPIEENYEEGVTTLNIGKKVFLINNITKMKKILSIFFAIILLSCIRESYFEQGLEKYNTGYFEDAIEIFTKEIKVNPSNEDAYYQRGNSKYALNDFYGALEDIDKALEITIHPAFLNNRSVINIRLGDFESAIEDASKAIELKKDYLEAYINRAGAYSMLNLNEKSIIDYTTALQFDSDNTVALSNRAVVYQKLNVLEKACEDWRKAADLSETNSIYFYKNYCE